MFLFLMKASLFIVHTPKGPYYYDLPTLKCVLSALDILFLYALRFMKDDTRYKAVRI